MGDDADFGAVFGADFGAVFGADFGADFGAVFGADFAAGFDASETSSGVSVGFRSLDLVKRFTRGGGWGDAVLDVSSCGCKPNGSKKNSSFGNWGFNLGWAIASRIRSMIVKLKCYA